MHHLKLLLMERKRTTAEETSIVEVPGAALFTDENLDDGEIVRATFGRGVITGEIAVTEASGHVRDDVLALVVSLADALPHDRWDWTDPPVTPIDLAALLLPPPAGTHNATCFRGHIAVAVYVVSSRVIDKANFVALVQQQYDRLP
jgi:hypothetical protein